jgi:hypothetical protein
MSAKTGLLLALICLGAALVFTVTSRMSEQAINVVVGLMCGVAASIPVSVGLLIALTRKRDAPVDSEEESDYPEPVYPYPSRSPRQPYPPVIVITPQQNQLPGPYAGLLPPGTFPPTYSLNEPPMTRDFRVIGEDDDSLDA